MNITILGGGNGGHAAACDLTLRGFSVTLYEDAAFRAKMKSVFETRRIAYRGIWGEGEVTLSAVTDDLAAAVSGAEIILVAVPAFAHRHYAEQLAPLVQNGQTVVIMPGTLGSLLFYKTFRTAGKTVTVAETHTLPYAARLTGEGEITVMDRFDPLKVGVMPACKTEETLSLLGQLYDGLQPMESAAACGLCNINPVIHVPACVLNAGRIEYAAQPFYCYREGFTACVARTTEQLDAERGAILQRLGYGYQPIAQSLSKNVQSSSIREVVTQDPSIANIAIPPSFGYRYFTEDIPYGLAVWAKLAALIGVCTPVMSSLVELGSCITGRDCRQGRSLAELGIEGMSLSQLQEYLMHG